MTRMVGHTVDLRIKTRQPFVLAEHDRCVTRRQFARQRRLARRGLSANEVQRAHQPNLPSFDLLKESAFPQLHAGSATRLIAVSAVRYHQIDKLPSYSTARWRPATGRFATEEMRMAVNSLQKQPARGPGRPFEKGRPGNPAGRPRGRDQQPDRWIPAFAGKAL